MREIAPDVLLLARGRDRLETAPSPQRRGNESLSHSLLLARGRDRLETVEETQTRQMTSISYSLGDAIDWKHRLRVNNVAETLRLLLARGRDRLETVIPYKL